MDKCGFLEFLWSVGECEYIEMELLPRGTYRIAERGVKIEGAAADLSHCVIENIESGLTYRGSVKIDQKSSDWRAAGTIDDPLFDNVIVHVVEQCDTLLLRANSQNFITCVITPNAKLQEVCARLPLSCKRIWSNLHSIKRVEILSRLLDDRVKRKMAEIEDMIAKNNCSWYEQCFLLFFRGMGTPSKNKDEFERIARLISYEFIVKHITHQRFIEGVLLGSVGYLDLEEDKIDQYTRTLRREYMLNKNIIDNNTIVTSWSKEPHRPTSAPALSLVQALTILVQRPTLFDDIFNIEPLSLLRDLFRVELPEYWQSHSAPSAGLGSVSATFTKKRIDILLLNFVIPLLLFKAKKSDDMDLWHRAFSYYEEIEAENFSIFNRWSSSNWQPSCAYESQALVQLYQEYCKLGKCSCCMIGREELLQVCRGGSFTSSSE